MSLEPVSLETPIGEDDDQLSDCIEDQSIPSPEDITGLYQSTNEVLINNLPERGDKSSQIRLS
jgi:DNA-directed RNA polymerase sigma subunit (sigma70/sigma32)